MWNMGRSWARKSLRRKLLQRRRRNTPFPRSSRREEVLSLRLLRLFLYSSKRKETRLFSFRVFTLKSLKSLWASFSGSVVFADGYRGPHRATLYSPQAQSESSRFIDMKGHLICNMMTKRDFEKRLSELKMDYFHLISLDFNCFQLISIDFNWFHLISNWFWGLRLHQAEPAERVRRLGDSGSVLEAWPLRPEGRHRTAALRGRLAGEERKHFETFFFSFSIYLFIYLFLYIFIYLFICL